MTSENKLLTLEEASQYLRMSKSWLYKQTMNKRITHLKPTGHKVFFYKKDLDNYLNKNVIKAE